MSVKIRIIADTKKDVLRDIELPNNLNLEDLNHAIIDAFELKVGEMSAFYYSNEQWDQLEEIPLMSFEDTSLKLMKDLDLGTAFKKEKDKLLFVYDFLNMKTFYVEATKVDEQLIMAPMLIQSIGEMPEEEVKQLSDQELYADIFAEEEKSEFDEFDDFDSFENIDDYDL